MIARHFVAALALRFAASTNLVVPRCAGAGTTPDDLP